FLGQQVGDDAQTAERLGGPFDISLGPCRHRDSYSLRRERMRDAETDPFRARGHESDLAVDAQVHRSMVVSPLPPGERARARGASLIRLGSIAIPFLPPGALNLDGPPVTPRPSATVLLVRGGEPWELLLMRRPGGADLPH